MAQAEAFETDFWKDANLRKAWDDIVPGAPRKTLTVGLYPEVSLAEAREHHSDARELVTAATDGLRKRTPALQEFVKCAAGT